MRFRDVEYGLLLAVAVPLGFAGFLVWNQGWHPEVKVATWIAVAGVSVYALARSRRIVIGRMNTVASVMDALRHGDYTVRARVSDPDDPIGQVVWQTNQIAETLRSARFGAMEATSLLDSAMEQIEVAILTLDSAENIRYANRQARELFGRTEQTVVGLSAEELGISDFIRSRRSALVDGVAELVTLDFAFPKKAGRWGVRVSTFREAGLPLKILTITDLSKTLREEERLAWQRLIRVLTHELNNSVAPIHSLSGTLKALVKKQPLPLDWEVDLTDGLTIIEGRSASLSKFVEAYSKLAKLPPAERSQHDLLQVVRRTAKLETRLAVRVESTVDVLPVWMDMGQIEQALINLIRNAVEATLMRQGQVVVRVGQSGSEAIVEVVDDGPGLANLANVFVPFFTTKSGGSGIGLALSRQIVDGHDGFLTLENRRDASGCVARMSLPSQP